MIDQVDASFNSTTQLAIFRFTAQIICSRLPRLGMYWTTAMTIVKASVAVKTSRLVMNLIAEGGRMESGNGSRTRSYDSISQNRRFNEGSPSKASRSS